MNQDVPAFRAYLAEAIGTFALVFAGTGAIVIDAVSGGVITHVGIALTFGLVVMAVIYAIGDVSGAHINPAVTVGFWASGRFPGRRVVPYAAAQMLGALGASVLLRVLFPLQEGLGGTYPSGSAAQSLVLEVVLTFFLMLVILCVAVGAKEKGLMAGTAIGGTVGLEALFAGPISGASMNPARSLAPALVTFDLSHQWLYIAAPVLGAFVAVLAYRGIYGDSVYRLFGRAAPPVSSP
ncbi:MAG: MIP/aquaporin family protein [Rhodothermales bacterium]